MTLDIAVRVDGQVVVVAGGRSTRPAWRRARGSASRRGPRDRRPAGVGVRLRRCAGVQPDRLHRLCVLGGRPGGLAATSRQSSWCPTTLTRCSPGPMVTSPHACIAIEIEADSHDALVFCDGRREMRVPAGGRLEVTKCSDPAEMGAAGQRAVHRPAGAQVPAAGHRLARDSETTMLAEIRIESLGAISAATAEFDRGLTVLTGETGTGKTMVVTGLHLLGGARADATRVRSGAERAVVEGRFTTDELDDATAAPDRRDPRLVGRRPRRRRQHHRAALGQPRRPVAGLPRRAQRARQVADHVHHRAAHPARAERPAAADAPRRAARRAGPLRRRRAPSSSATGKCATSGRWPAAISSTAPTRARELAQEADRLKFALDRDRRRRPDAGRGRGAGRRHPPALRTRRAAGGGRRCPRRAVGGGRRGRRRPAAVGHRQHRAGPIALLQSTDDARAERAWPASSPRR